MSIFEFSPADDCSCLVNSYHTWTFFIIGPVVGLIFLFVVQFIVIGVVTLKHYKTFGKTAAERQRVLAERNGLSFRVVASKETVDAVDVEANTMQHPRLAPPATWLKKSKVGAQPGETKASDLDAKAQQLSLAGENGLSVRAPKGHAGIAVGMEANKAHHDSLASPATGKENGVAAPPEETKANDLHGRDSFEYLSVFEQAHVALERDTAHVRHPFFVSLITLSFVLFGELTRTESAFCFVQLWDRFIQILLFLTYITYPAITRQCFVLLNCTELDHGQFYLVGDFRINCDDAEYRRFFWPAIIAAVVYPFGMFTTWNRWAVCSPVVSCTASASSGIPLVIALLLWGDHNAKTVQKDKAPNAQPRDRQGAASSLSQRLRTFKLEPHPLGDGYGCESKSSHG